MNREKGTYLNGRSRNSPTSAAQFFFVRFQVFFFSGFCFLNFRCFFVLKSKGIFWLKCPLFFINLRIHMKLPCFQVTMREFLLCLDEYEFKGGITEREWSDNK